MKKSPLITVIYRYVPFYCNKNESGPPKKLTQATELLDHVKFLAVGGALILSMAWEGQEIARPCTDYYI